MNEYFVVAIEGVSNWFSNYEQALEEYEQLKALGYHEAVLRFHSDSFDRPLIYSDKAHCLIPM